MKKILILVLSLFLLSSCGNNSGSNEENNIIDDIKYLANNKLNFNFDLKLKSKEKTDQRDELLNNLREAAIGDDKAAWLLDNFDNLSEVEQLIIGNDDDAIEFIYNYNNDITDFEYKEGQSKDYGRKTPYYCQFDNRWAYDELGSSILGIQGCGPTSVSMILSRLKNDPSITPRVIAKDAKGYMVDAGISWEFFDTEAKKYKLKISDVNINEEDMQKALEKGPLLVSVQRGYFTLGGHILVIDSYKNGEFVINDPNSYKNSEKSWTFDQIGDQIVKIWQIS